MIIINILKKIQITSLFNVIYIYIKKLNKKMERKAPYKHGIFSPFISIDENDYMSINSISYRL